MSALPERPALRRDLRVELVDPNHVFLLAEDGAKILTGNAYGPVIALLDGTLTVGELVARLDGAVSLPEVHYVLQGLAEHALLGPGGAAQADGPAAFWHLDGVDPGDARQRLSAARVSVRALGGADAQPLAGALGRLGVAVRDGSSADLDVEAPEPGGPAGSGAAQLEIVVVAHYLDPELEAVNARALATGRDWMLVKPSGRVAWVGPIMRPGRTACWRCLAERLRRNRQVEDFVMRRRGYAAPPDTSLAASAGSLAAASAIAATAVAQLLVTGEHVLERALRAIDLAALDQRDHAVVRRPQCPACGSDVRRDGAAPLALSTVPRIAASDGGHRAVSPEQTLERLRHQVSPITGVVSYLEPTHGASSTLMHAYTAGHNFAMGLDTMYWLKRSLRTQTGGKGMTRAQAQVSALGEAIERYCGVHRGDEPATRASYATLGADAAIHLDELLHFSDRQYAERERHNAADAMRPIPNRFDESVEIDWTAAWSLTAQRPRYLPSCFCFYGHPDSAEHFFCSGDTNGCAAGSTIEEAVLQAFCELVERDCVATWWYNRVARPAVDLDSVALPYVQRLRAHYASLRRELWVLELTSDLGMPCYAALSRRTDRPVEDVVFGFGAHLDPQVALLRAITECNQFLPAVLTDRADGTTAYQWPEDEAISFWREETVARQPWLLPDPASAPRPLPARDDAAADLGSDVAACVAIARAHGLELLVVDQSHADVELAVARVVVPGLRHFWRRLGPGRLYDVPVRLGWRGAPLAEDDLNPLSVFI